MIKSLQGRTKPSIGLHATHRLDIAGLGYRLSFGLGFTFRV